MIITGNKMLPFFIKKQNPTIAIAPDSFKGSLDAAGVAKAIAAGLSKSFPMAEYRQIPMADGGEGTVDAWATCTKAEIITTRVLDPLGRYINAALAFDSASSTAVIEMAAASGLPLLKNNERNPLAASTCGTGELLLRALDLGAKHIILGIGGSATNDGGTGMATALGVRFLDANGRPLPHGGGALVNLAAIDMSRIDKRLGNVNIEVACDVTNPLCGPRGASAVYGPQKGASPEDVMLLDTALQNLADIAAETKGVSSVDANAQGAGAAGGLGFGLMVFCGAKLKRGIEIIANSVGLREKIKDCDLVITGEGRIDGQTINGKTPAGVAAIAKEANVPCIAICGCTGDGYEKVKDIGIEAVFPVVQGFYDPDNPSLGAKERITLCAEEVGKTLLKS